MNTKDIIKYAALAVAAYLFYKYLKDSGVFGAAAVTQPVAAAPPGAQPTAVSPPTQQPGEITTPIAHQEVKAAPTLSVKQRVWNRAIVAGYGPVPQLTYDEWNYFYQQETGSYAKAFEEALPGVARTLKMPIDAFWQQAVGGLSGLAGSLQTLAAMRAGNAWIV